MRFCKEHWDICRAAVEARGMMPLVARDRADSVLRMLSELDGADLNFTFDPLMSLFIHFGGEALRCGGLYIMGQNETGENGGHYCPVCEFVKHSPNFAAKAAIDGVADEMAVWAREQGLIPKVQ